MNERSQIATPRLARAPRPRYPKRMNLDEALDQLARMLGTAELPPEARESVESMVELCDALHWLRGQPSASIKSLIIDPPYCAGGFQEAKQASATCQGVTAPATGGWFASDNMSTAGYLWLTRAVACEAHRVLVDGGHLLMFCDWRQSYNLAPALESSGLRFRSEVIWDKGSAGLGTGFRMRHEKILSYCKGSPAYATSTHGTVLSFRAVLEDGGVIPAKRVASKRRKHPTEKPAELLEVLVAVTSEPGDVVADCFAGSGSLAPVCQRLGRVFRGCEREPHFVQTARERTGQAGAGPLFG